MEGARPSKGKKGELADIVPLFDGYDPNPPDHSGIHHRKNPITGLFQSHSERFCDPGLKGFPR